MAPIWARRRHKANNPALTGGEAPISGAALAAHRTRVGSSSTELSSARLSARHWRFSHGALFPVVTICSTVHQWRLALWHAAFRRTPWRTLAVARFDLRATGRACWLWRDE